MYEKCMKNRIQRWKKVRTVDTRSSRECRVYLMMILPK